MKSKIFYSGAISNDFGLLILRLVSGGTILTHGWMKLQNVLAGKLEFGDPVGLGVETSLYLTIFAEVLCAMLVILGLLTRIALVPLIITMLVAFFVVHSQDPFNIKELSFLYLGMYITLFLAGPGRLSVDSRL